MAEARTYELVFRNRDLAIIALKSYFIGKGGKKSFCLSAPTVSSNLPEKSVIDF